MRNLKLYGTIAILFSFHGVFNMWNEGNVSEIVSISWILVAVSFFGFVGIILYVRKSNYEHSVFAYLLSSAGIILSILQVMNWYILKDIGF